MPREVEFVACHYFFYMSTNSAMAPVINVLISSFKKEVGGSFRGESYSAMHAICGSKSQSSSAKGQDLQRLHLRSRDLLS